MATTPWLSQIEGDDLCEPLKQHAVQVRFIRGLGVPVRTKPNDTPLVIRAHMECDKLNAIALADKKKRNDKGRKYLLPVVCRYAARLAILQ